jgi:Na+-transporting NADH:ubiquinone oxidoreductase subunit NqrD
MWSPLQAFLDGISSTIGRYLVVILVLFAGFTTSAPWENSSVNFFLQWCVASFAMPLEWATYFDGFGCLIGFAALVWFIIFATIFIYEWWKSGASIFGMYTSAVMYFLPLSDENECGMVWAGLSYLLVCICVWGLPWFFRRIQK